MYIKLIMLVVLLASAIAYVVYQRYIHSLSQFPGPFWASLTNFWRFYHELTGDLPEVIHRYHTKYGPVVRVAPGEVNVNSADVIDIVYKKGGRYYPKTDFYDGFTAIRANVFGTRDESLHALRRRQMAHAFSQASLVKMEYIFDRHVLELIEKLDTRAQQGTLFDLRHVLKYYAQDTNGDLSLGVQFGTQRGDDPKSLAPLNDHVALAKLTGYVPWLKPYFDRYGSRIPWPYLQKLLRARAWMKSKAEEVTDLEFTRVGRVQGKGQGQLLGADDRYQADRFNLFTALVTAKDPNTGEYIEREDIASNALTFLTAGSHSTAATLEIIFWYLMHYPEVLQKVVDEIDTAYDSPTVPSNQGPEEVLSFEGMEARLPYLSAVFKEVFRLSPTFQHPAPRLTPRDTLNPRFPTVVADQLIPPNYGISVSVLSMHHNPLIWGEQAANFVPKRWFDAETKHKEGLLMHFGAGHRACIGRNQSLIMLWKAVVEILRRFEVELVEPDGGVQPQNIKLRARGFAELIGPLDVKVQKRK